MERGSRTRLTTAAVLVVVFCAGVLLGLAADSNLEAEPPETVIAVEGEATAEEEAPRRRRRIYDEVGPNERQLALIDSIVAEHRARTTALDEQMNAGFRGILLETREAIKSVLTPDQAARYQQLLDEYDTERDAERAAKEAVERDKEDDRN